jgi:hypothetical protein
LYARQLEGIKGTGSSRFGTWTSCLEAL